MTKPTGPYGCPEHGFTNYIHKGRSGSYVRCLICELRQIKHEIAHYQFKVMEDDELYCTGIVFDLNDV